MQNAMQNKIQNAIQNALQNAISIHEAAKGRSGNQNTHTLVWQQ